MKLNCFSWRLFLFTWIIFMYRDKQIRDVLLFLLYVLNWVKVFLWTSMKPNFFADYFYLRDLLFRYRDTQIKNFFYYTYFLYLIGLGFFYEAQLFCRLLLFSWNVFLVQGYQVKGLFYYTYFIFVNYSLGTGITKEGTFYYSYFIYFIGLRFFLWSLTF